MEIPKVTLDGKLNAMECTIILQLNTIAKKWNDGVLVLANTPWSVNVLQEAWRGVEEDIEARVKAYAEKTGSEWTQLFPTYASIPVTNGELSLGKYQRIINFSEASSNASIPVFFFPAHSAIKKITKDTGASTEFVLETVPGTYREKGGERVYDITEALNRFVESTGLSKGQAFIMSGHTTMSVMAFEAEGDYRYLLDRLRLVGEAAPTNAEYTHNDWSVRDVPPDETKNGVSHVRSAIIGGSASIPVTNGKPELKKKVCIIDHDAPRQGREVTFAVSRTDVYETDIFSFKR